METNKVPFVFSRWFQLIAFILVVSYLSYSCFNLLGAEEFIQVGKGNGTHKSIESNGERTFVECGIKCGEFIRMDAKQRLSTVNWGLHQLFWLSLAFLCMLLRDVFYILRIKALTGESLKYPRAVPVIFLWEFASALAPGVMSGASVAMFILHREKIPLGKATAVVILTAFLDNLFFVLSIPIVFFGLYLVNSVPIQSSTIEGLFWTGYAFFGIFCGLLGATLFLYPALIKNLLSFFTQFRFLKKFNSNALKTGNEIQQTSLVFKKNTLSFWCLNILYTSGAWLSRFLVVNCLLHAFLTESKINDIYVVAKQFVIWMLMRVAPTPGGSGVAEWAFEELLKEFSINASLIVGIALIWRLISYYPYLIIGGFLLPKWLKKTQTFENKVEKKVSS